MYLFNKNDDTLLWNILQFDWLLYLNTVFSQVNYTFENSTEMVITSPDFYRQMVDKVLATPNRTIANYMLWRFTANRIRNLPKDIQAIKQKFDQVSFAFHED